MNIIIEEPNRLPIKIAGMIFGKRYYCTGLVGCGKAVLGFKDRLSAREYRITRLCQNCQDQLFEGLE